MAFEQKVNRIAPLGPANAYQTYSISVGRDVEVVAACKDVGCEYWRDGWDTHIDESTDLGKAQASYIRRQSGRTFTELRTAAGITIFRFASGQRCFREHRTRPDLFVVRDGDWRGNPTKRGRVHANGRDWAEDFAEHEIALADLRQKG